MDSMNLQAWWAHKQGLDSSMAGHLPSQVLESAGWARSVGGVGPYLTLFSRSRHSREVVDKALADCEIQELPRPAVAPTLFHPPILL